MIALVFGILGLIVGSFLNVVILRHRARMLGGRSACMSCGRTLRWYDLVPVFSWVALGGRCRICRASISVQYPLVEGMTGILFAFVGVALVPLFVNHGMATLFLLLDYLAIASLLIAIAAYDLRHTIIPDEWVYSCAFLALVSQFSLVPLQADPLSILIAGPLVAMPLYLLWFVSKGTWMGFGDVKLALGMGWLLGIQNGLLALFLAFIIGGIFSMPLLFFSSGAWRTIVAKFIPYHLWLTSGKGFTMKSEVPFGPFLIMSTIGVWFAVLSSIQLNFFFFL